MNTNNKNAYEIRLEVLKIAYETMYDTYHQKIDFHRRNSEIHNKLPELELIDSLSPKPKDILAYAEELYTFVENK